MASSITIPSVAVEPPAPRNNTAAAVAKTNLAANLEALSRTQPRLAAEVGATGPGLTAVYGRDGSLTAFGPDGKWWHNCSVPLRAAERILSTLDVKGRVACFLRPTLAAQVRVALERARRDQAIIAVCPDVTDLRVLLACDDFSAEVRSHRLWFAWGGRWAEELKRLFAERPGLATPAQFVRLPTTPAEEIEPLVAAARAVFAEANAARVADVARRREGWHRPTTGRPRLCVVAPSQFRLWEDAGAVLAETLLAQAAGVADVTAFDPDDPACSATPALLGAAADCSAVVAADTSRGDVPGVVPVAMPWITWVTRRGAIPPYAGAARADALVLADAAWRSDAAAMGWPAGRVAVGGWPTVQEPAGDATPPAPVLAVVADTRPVTMPPALDEFSSHQLLWNHVAAELASDPFAIGEGPGPYLERSMKRHGVSAEGFDAGLFLERLILPAYAQGIARTLVRGGMPVRLFGAGWDEIAEFRPLAAGPVRSRLDLADIRRAVSAVVNAAPDPDACPLRRLGRPVVSAAGYNRQRFVEAARRAIPTPPQAAVPAPDALTLRQVLALLGTD